MKLNDVLENFKKFETDIKLFDDKKRYEIINEMMEKTISNLHLSERLNLVNFLNTMTPDIVMFYLCHVLEKEVGSSDPCVSDWAVDFLADKSFIDYRPALLSFSDKLQMEK